MVLQAGTLVLVARLFGPGEFGAFAGIAALAFTLGTLSTFGTHLLVLAETSKAPEREPEALHFAPITTLVGCGLVFVVYLFIVAVGFGTSGVSLSVVVAIGITEIGLQPLLSLPSAYLQGRGRVATSQMLVAAPLTIRLLLAAVLTAWSVGNALQTYAYGCVIISAVVSGWAVLAFRRMLPALRRWRFASPSELRQAAAFAALNVAATGPSELDKTLALRLLPSTNVGIYSAGARVVGATTLPILALMLSATPRLFREGEVDRSRTRRLLRKIFIVSTSYGIIVAAGLWVSSPVLPWLFGDSYSGIDGMMRLLAFGVPGMALRVAAGGALMALGKPWIRFAFEASGMAILGITAFALTPWLGTAGMPIALASTEICTAALGWTAIAIITRKDGE